MFIPRMLAIVISVALLTLASPGRAGQGYGEGCSVFKQCGAGLSCQPFSHKCYTSPREVGEPCSAGYGCADGLTCKLFRCVPADLEWDDDRLCKALYSENIAKRVRAGKMAKSFGQGMTFSLPLTGSSEVGVVYGENGEFGCYQTTCAGFGHDLAIGTFAAFSQVEDFANFAGKSQVYSAGASVPIVEIGGSVGVVVAEGSDGADPVGTVQTVGIGLGFFPAQISPLRCVTDVNTVDAAPATPAGPPPEPGVLDEFDAYGTAYPVKEDPSPYLAVPARSAASCAQICNDHGDECRAFYFQSASGAASQNDNCKLSPLTSAMSELGLVTDELTVSERSKRRINWSAHQYYERRSVTRNGVPDEYETEATDELLRRDPFSARFLATDIHFYANDPTLSKAMGMKSARMSEQAASLRRRTTKLVGVGPGIGYAGTWSLFGAFGETVVDDDPDNPVRDTGSLVIRNPKNQDRFTVDFEHGVVLLKPGKGGVERKFQISAVYEVTEANRAAARKALHDGCAAGRESCVACRDGTIGLDRSQKTLRLYDADGEIRESYVSKRPISDILECPYGGLLTVVDRKDVYFSPDCRDPEGGGRTIRVYRGSQTVTGLAGWKDKGVPGVLTALSGGGQYFSPDCRNLGGGGNTRRLH